jgi:uncharacterized membrane protein
LYYAHQAILVFHVLAGVVALVSMWLPMLSKKGGKLHRRGGKVYVSAMGVTCGSAFVASGLRIARRPDELDAPLFLMLVGLLAAVATLWGVRVLRQKKRKAAHRGALEWMASISLTAAGVGAIGYWALGGGMVLFVVFGVLCVWTGGGFVQVLRNPPKSKMFWWYEHLGGMIVACISTLTAFLVVNYAYAPAVVKAAIPGIAVWVAPGVIGGIAIAILTRRYKNKLEPTGSDA